MRRLLLLLMFLWVPALEPGIVWGIDGSPEAASTLSMQPVVVTAGRVEETKKEITSYVTVIDRAYIRNSAALDLGELLAEKGIGHIQKYPGALTAVGIRGFRTDTHGNDLRSHVLVLLNGHRAGTGNLAKIPTKNIERIEILRGPAAVQYGSAGMGGIINVITKKGTGKPSIFVEGALGSFDYEETTAGFSGQYNLIDFSGTYTSESMDDYDTARGEKYPNTAYDGKNYVSLHLGYTFLPGNRLSLVYNSFDGNDIGSPNYLSQNDTDDFTDKAYESTDLIYEGRTGEGTFSWKARYFWGRDDDTWFDPTGSNPDWWDDGIPYKLNTYQKGAQVQASFVGDIFQITGGIDWVNYEIETTSEPRKTEYDNPACFLMGTSRLLEERLILNAGVRYDQYDVEIKSPTRSDEDDDNFSFQAGIAFLLTDYLKIRGHYGEAFMMPSASQLAADYYSWGTHIIGNPNLDPEKSKTYEGGVDLFHRWVNASLSYFYTDYKDKIQSVYSAAGQSWENSGSATIQGFEGEFDCELGAILDLGFQLRPYFNFVYLTEYKDEETDTDLRYVSKTNLSYGIHISGFDGLQANLNLAYTGRQKVDDWESGWPAPVVKKGGYTVASLTVSKKIVDTDQFGDLTLGCRIQNLFDKDYEHVKGYPMPGRSIFVGLKYEY